MVGLPDGAKTSRICITVSDRIPACVDRTDRWTDRWKDRETSCHGIVSATHTRRAVKTGSRNDTCEIVMERYDLRTMNDEGQTVCGFCLENTLVTGESLFAYKVT